MKLTFIFVNINDYSLIAHHTEFKEHAGNITNKMLLDRAKEIWSDLEEKETLRFKGVLQGYVSAFKPVQQFKLGE